MGTNTRSRVKEWWKIRYWNKKLLDELKPDGGKKKTRWRRMNRIRKISILKDLVKLDLGNNGGWNCQVRLWWRRLTSPDCCSSLTAGGQPDIPSCPVRRNRQHRTPPRTQPWWNAESESPQASRSTTAHHEHKGQIHISSENTINQNHNVDKSPGQKNGPLFILIKWYDPQP